LYKRPFLDGRCGLVRGPDGLVRGPGGRVGGRDGGRGLVGGGGGGVGGRTTAEQECSVQKHPSAFGIFFSICLLPGRHSGIATGGHTGMHIDLPLLQLQFAHLSRPFDLSKNFAPFAYVFPSFTHTGAFVVGGGGGFVVGMGPRHPFAPEILLLLALLSLMVDLREHLFDETVHVKTLHFASLLHLCEHACQELVVKSLPKSSPGYWWPASGHLAICFLMYTLAPQCFLSKSSACFAANEASP